MITASLAVNAFASNLGKPGLNVDFAFPSNPWESHLGPLNISFFTYNMGIIVPTAVGSVDADSKGNQCFVQGPAHSGGSVPDSLW